MTFLKKSRKWHQLSYTERKSIFYTYIYSLNLINLMLSQYKVFVYLNVNFILAGISKRRKTIIFNGPFNSKVDLYINMAFTSKVYEIKRFFCFEFSFSNILLYSLLCTFNIQHHHFAVNFSFSCLSKFYVEFFILYTLSRIIKFSESWHLESQELCQRLHSVSWPLIGQFSLTTGLWLASDSHIVLDIVPEARPGLERLVEEDDGDEEDDVDHGHRQADVWHLQ